MKNKKLKFRFIPDPMTELTKDGFCIFGTGLYFADSEDIKIESANIKNL